MVTRILTLAFCALAVSQSASAKECWALTEMKGQIAFSVDKYVFQLDKFSNPMVLCFEDKSGSVSGDDTHLMRFGTSTLAGWATNKGIELFEVYQIDRINGKVLFTKSRIGTDTLILGGPDVVGAFVGKAVKVSE